MTHRKAPLEIVDIMIAEVEKALDAVKEARREAIDVDLPHFVLKSKTTFDKIRETCEYIEGQLRNQILKSVRDFQRYGNVPIEPPRAKYF